MNYVFRYKIRHDELVQVLLNHLKIEGMLSDREIPLFKSIEKSGSSTILEFVVGSQEGNENEKNNSSGGRN